ncbi:MAG: helix-turn-helix domain-containing protein [Methanobacteriota archaeon]
MTTDPRDEGPASPRLTPRQRIALLAAVRAGYYEIPRRVTLRDLAGEMTMSATALSELLRRAEATLVLAYVAADRDEAPLEEV